MWRHYVYVHRCADSGRIFYVGKGTVRRGSRIERAYDRSSRNQYWRRVVDKHGLMVEVVASFVTDQAAQAFERDLIAEYGRKNLVNLTDGGDGCSGISPSAEARAKLSVLAKRPRTEAWVRSIREARKGGGNGGVVKRGDKLPESWRQSISAGQRGPNNYMRGRTGAAAPRSRAVLDTATGALYPSVKAAAEATGTLLKTLHNRLSGHRPNTTTMRFA